MMTPMARCTHHRAGLIHHPLPMASLPMVVPSQASPLLLTPLVPTSLCTQASRGATLPVLTRDSLTPLGLQEQAILLPCPLLSHLQYHQMS